MAFLMWPTDLLKYSYSKKLGIESVHWYAVKSCVKVRQNGERAQGEDIYA